jgi:hypothetical protein
MNGTIDIQFQFINHGKTPAIIKTASGEFNPWADIPRRIHYSDPPLSGEIIIRAGEIYPQPIERAVTSVQARISERTGVAAPTHIFYQGRQKLVEFLDAESVRGIKEGHNFLWFYGHIVYDDVFGREHETRFCWCYNGLTNSFQQYNRGDEGLNRRTQYLTRAHGALLPTCHLPLN